MSLVRIASTVVLLLSSSICSFAQRGSRIPQPGEIRIKITYEDQRFVPTQLRVELLNGMGSLIAQKISDRSGQITFSNIFPGTYQIHITSTEIEEYNGDVFAVLDGGGTHFESVRVRPRVDAKPSSSSGGISVRELNVPEKAGNEFNKGMAAFRKNENAEARMRFEKAIQIYPNYGAAYNSLGVMAMNAGDPEGGEANFKKSIAVDPKHALAYVNMSKILFQRQNFVQAKELLQTASGLDGRSGEALMLLANVCLATKDFDLTISSAQKLHALPQHEQFGVTHFLAAEALERKGEPSKALTEYQIFLVETPGSPMADTARKNIASLEKMSRQ